MPCWGHGWDCSAKTSRRKKACAVITRRNGRWVLPRASTCPRPYGPSLVWNPRVLFVPTSAPGAELIAETAESSAITGFDRFGSRYDAPGLNAPIAADCDGMLMRTATRPTIAEGDDTLNDPVVGSLRFTRTSSSTGIHSMVSWPAASRATTRGTATERPEGADAEASSAPGIRRRRRTPLPVETSS